MACLFYPSVLALLVVLGFAMCIPRHSRETWTRLSSSTPGLGIFGNSNRSKNEDLSTNIKNTCPNYHFPGIRKSVHDAQLQGDSPHCDPVNLELKSSIDGSPSTREIDKMPQGETDHVYSLVRLKETLFVENLNTKRDESGVVCKSALEVFSATSEVWPTSNQYVSPSTSASVTSLPSIVSTSNSANSSASPGSSRELASGGYASIVTGSISILVLIRAVFLRRLRKQRNKNSRLDQQAELPSFFRDVNIRRSVRREPTLELDVETTNLPRLSYSGRALFSNNRVDRTRPGLFQDRHLEEDTQPPGEVSYGWGELTQEPEVDSGASCDADTNESDETMAL